MLWLPISPVSLVHASSRFHGIFLRPTLFHLYDRARFSVVLICCYILVSTVHCRLSQGTPYLTIPYHSLFSLFMHAFPLIIVRPIRSLCCPSYKLQHTSLRYPAACKSCSLLSVFLKKCARVCTGTHSMVHGHSNTLLHSRLSDYNTVSRFTM